MGLFNRKPKWKHENPEVRLKAVKELDDEVALSYLARKDPDGRVRVAAVGRLEDQDDLYEIAKNDSNDDVRVAAVGRLEDQDELYEIAKNDSDDYVREVAVRWLEDQDELYEIAKNDSNDKLRAVAVYKIKDKNVVAEFLDDPSEPVRVEAFKSYGDKELIFKHVCDDNESFSLRTTLIRNLTDEQLKEVSDRYPGEDPIGKIARERLSREPQVIITHNDPSRSGRLSFSRHKK